jgi:hypothetical protein
VALGVDIDELQPAGATIPVAVRIHGIDPDAAARSIVTATVTDPADPAPPTKSRLGWDGDRSVFTADLPARTPGMYEVDVTAKAVPGGGDLTSQVDIAVVDGDGLD